MNTLTLKNAKQTLIKRWREGKLETELKEDVWKETFNKVKSFVENNNCYPSIYSEDNEEKKLCFWITAQKQAKKGQGYYRITNERILSLESLPNWKWGTNLDDVWKETFNKVKSFVENNNCYPSIYSEDNEEKKLCSWITNQKQAKKGQGYYRITEERIFSLESLLNWKW
jgi:hypothetical protein